MIFAFIYSTWVPRPKVKNIKKLFFKREIDMNDLWFNIGKILYGKITTAAINPLNTSDINARYYDI